MSENYKIENLKPLSGYKKLHTIGSANRKHNLYKYMNAERAIQFIESKKICFVEPVVWNDPYEKRFYTADYSNFNDYKPPKKIFCTCTTLNETSEAAWSIYSSNSTGLASRCVQFKFNRREFLKTIDNFTVDNSFHFYEGSTVYDLDDYTIKNLHKRESLLFKKIFEDFDLTKYLNLLLIKRRAFEYENELRYFILPNNIGKTDKLFIEFNIKELIKSISIDHKCSDFEYELIKTKCKEAGIKVEIKKFDLYEYDKDLKITIDSIE